MSYDFPSVTVCNMNMMKKSLISDVEKFKTLVEIDESTRIKVEDQVWDMMYERRKKRSVEEAMGPVNEGVDTEVAPPNGLVAPPSDENLIVVGNNTGGKTRSDVTL